MSQFLKKENFNEILKFVEKISDDEIISNSSYDENLLMKKFNSFSDDSKLKLAKCAIQIAIVGAGGNSYGQIKHNDEILEITQIFDDHEIKYFAEENTKFDVDDFTPRRLVRLFRYLIKEYIEVKERYSYLWKKYCGVEEFKNICFPGAEHLVSNKIHANNLIETYKKLDEDKGTNFVRRLKFVFNARGIEYDK